MEENPIWKRNVLIVGGLIGAVVGVIAAGMLVKEAAENDNESAITPARGLQIGMLVLGLLRQITKV